MAVSKIPFYFFYFVFFLSFEKYGVSRERARVMILRHQRRTRSRFRRHRRGYKYDVFRRRRHPTFVGRTMGDDQHRRGVSDSGQGSLCGVTIITTTTEGARKK